MASGNGSHSPCIHTIGSSSCHSTNVMLMIVSAYTTHSRLYIVGASTPSAKELNLSESFSLEGLESTCWHEACPSPIRLTSWHSPCLLLAGGFCVKRASRLSRWVTKAFRFERLLFFSATTFDVVACWISFILSASYMESGRLASLDFYIGLDAATKIKMENYYLWYRRWGSKNLKWKRLLNQLNWRVIFWAEWNHCIWTPRIWIT